MKNVKMFAIVALTVVSTQIALATATTSAPIDANAIALSIQDFVEIEISALPETVQETLAVTYEGAEVTKAFVNKEGIYKLEIVKTDLEKTVYINSKGELVDM